MGIELAGMPYDDRGLRRPPAAAVGLSAIRGLSDGSTQQYTAVGFHSNWCGVEQFIRTLRAAGYIRPSSSAERYAALNVLDANDDVIFDYDIPTSRAFRYVKRTLRLAVEPVLDEPVAAAGARSPGGGGR